jgi:hypothetical protein
LQYPEHSRNAETEEYEGSGKYKEAVHGKTSTIFLAGARIVAFKRMAK